MDRKLARNAGTRKEGINERKKKKKERKVKENEKKNLISRGATLQHFKAQ